MGVDFMDQIVDWVGLFSDAHSVLSSFVLALGQVLLVCAPLYVTYLLWKTYRRVMYSLSDYDEGHYSEAVYDDEGNYIGEDTDDGFVSADEMAEIESDAMSDLNDPSNQYDPNNP